MLPGLVALWLGTALAGGLVPADPQVITDDLVSVSCVAGKGCWTLDAAGNLWFDPRGGTSLRLRGRFPHHGLARVRFTGLLEGFALDRKGGLWRTRDGGRAFHSLGLPAGLAFKDLELGAGGEARLLALDGGVWRAARGEAPALLHPGEGKPGLELSVAPDGALAALGVQGEVRAWPAGGGEPRRSLPLEGQPLGLLHGADGALWVTGCRGEVRVSRDGGATWQAAPALPGPWQAICPRPVGALPDGRVLLAGLTGEALAGPRADPGGEAGWLRVRAGPERAWREAAAWEGGLLLVGDGGGRARYPGREAAALDAAGPSPASLLALVCLEGGRAFRLHAGGALWFSRDHGATWEARGPAPDGITELWFFDERHGLGLEAHALHGTADGGKSWTPLGRWPELSLAGLAARERRRILLVGEGGGALRSEDGGKSWTQDRLPTDRGLTAAAWPEPRTLYAVGEKRLAFRSPDGGRTWTQLSSGRGTLGAVRFLDARLGWLGGAEGMLLATRDGGATWALRQVQTSEALQGLAFVDRLRGLAAAGRGGLFRTSDGGESWQAWPLATRAAVTRVACWKKPRRCLVGGEQGLLLVGDPFRGPPPEPAP